MIFIVKIYVRLACKIPRHKLIARTTIFFMSNLLIFYVLALMNVPIATLGILFFIWVGMSLLMDLSWGMGLIGVSAIVLLGQAARRSFGLRLEPFWVVVGVLFLFGGVWELNSIVVDLLPILLISGLRVQTLPVIGPTLERFVPTFITQGLNVKFYFGGTSLLIVVGVAMDTVQQIESQLIVRHYEGFMKGTRIRGRRG